MTVVGKLEEALAAPQGTPLPKVIWLSAASCSGCTISLANLFSNSGPRDLSDLLFNTIDLMYHPTLMGAAGDLAVQQLKDTAQGSYILAVEGGIPTAFNGYTCMLWSDGGKDVTAMEAVQMLAPNATAVLSIGTCASYGGVSSANPNPTGVVSVSALTGLKTVNIPGCPTHPDWIIWTIAHLLSGQMPQLDNQNRPSALYGTEIHKVCPRKDQGEAKTFGVPHKCLEELGCKGPKTQSDCPARKWNNGSNWCIGAGAICIGCTERDFPDRFSPFYKVQYGYQDFQKPAPSQQPDPQTNPQQNPQPDPQTNPQPDPQPTPSAGPLLFTKAKWEVDKSRLKAEGKGEAGRIVTIFNADSGSQLGAVSVDRSGKWKFKQRRPAPIPRRLQASSGGQTVFSDVANAPAAASTPDAASSQGSSGTSTAAVDNRFKLKKAEWRADKRELKVKGEGTAGTVVEVYNGSTGSRLGKVTIDSDEEWKLVIKRPAPVPCTVRVVAKGLTVTQAVKKAPGDCV